VSRTHGLYSSKQKGCLESLIQKSPRQPSSPTHEDPHAQRQPNADRRGVSFTLSRKVNLISIIDFYFYFIFFLSSYTRFSLDCTTVSMVNNPASFQSTVVHRDTRHMCASLSPLNYSFRRLAANVTRYSPTALFPTATHVTNIKIT